MIITIGRKPFEKTVSENAKYNGCGGINIDACRVGEETRFNASAATDNRIYGNFKGGEEEGRYCVGRFPANLVLSEDIVEALDDQSGILKCGKANSNSRGWGAGGDVAISSWVSYGSEGYDDEGGASRYFFKVSK